MLRNSSLKPKYIGPKNIQNINLTYALPLIADTGGAGYLIEVRGDKIWIMGIQFGLRYSDDFGKTFRLISNNIPEPNFLPYAFAVNPSNDNKIIMSEGMFIGRILIEPGRLAYTKNNGETWKILPRLDNSVYINYLFYFDNVTVFACTDVGLFRGTEQSDNFVWKKVSNIMQGTIKKIPNTNNLIGGFKQDQIYGIFKSIDNGFTWTLKYTLPDMGTTTVIPSKDPKILYAVSDNKKTHAFFGIFKSNDSGENWIQIGFPSTPLVELTPTCPECSLDGTTLAVTMGSQGFYDQTIAVNPTNPNQFIYGGATPLILAEKSPSSEEYKYLVIASWINLPCCIVQSDVNGTYNENLRYVHADHHQTLWLSDHRVIDINDSGIAISSPIKNISLWEGDITKVPLEINWDLSKSRTLPLALYDIASTPSQKNLVLCGTQDNGTFRPQINEFNQWIQTAGGDGGGSIINYHLYDLALCSATSSTFTSIDGGQNFSTLYDTGYDIHENKFTPQYYVDPTDKSGLALYTFTQHIIFKSELFGMTPFEPVTYSNVQGLFPPNPPFNVSDGSEINSLSFHPVTKGTIVLTRFTGEFQVWITRNYMKNWTQLPLPPQVKPAQNIFDNRILITKNNTIYLGYSNFSLDQKPYLYKFKLSKNVWKTVNLPSYVKKKPIFSLFETKSGLLFIGTAAGAYVKQKHKLLKIDIPNFPVTSFYLPTNYELQEMMPKMYISTFGQGAFSVINPEYKNEYNFYEGPKGDLVPKIIIIDVESNLDLWRSLKNYAKVLWTNQDRSRVIVKKHYSTKKIVKYLLDNPLKNGGVLTIAATSTVDNIPPTLQKFRIASYCFEIIDKRVLIKLTEKEDEKTQIVRIVIPIPEIIENFFELDKNGVIPPPIVPPIIIDP